MTRITWNADGVRTVDGVPVPDDTPNFSDFTDAVEVPREDHLQMLVSMASKLREKINAVADAQATLDLLSADLNRYQLGVLPEAMQLAGVADYTLSDGTRLTVRPDVKASISIENRPYAHAWLKEHGHGGVVKESFLIDLRTLDPTQREMLKSAIMMHEVIPESLESVHAATLKSLVKELLEKGTTLPPSISVFEFKKAELKEPKKAK
jgi:hypothetical protein